MREFYIVVFESLSERVRCFVGARDYFRSEGGLLWGSVLMVLLLFYHDEEIQLLIIQIPSSKPKLHTTPI